jgi:glycine hydroxymethyltransferase
MDQIADFIARILVEKEDANKVGHEVAEFRMPFQTVYYCFDNGYSPKLQKLNR